MVWESEHSLQGCFLSRFELSDPFAVKQAHIIGSAGVEMTFVGSGWSTWKLRSSNILFLTMDLEDVMTSRQCSQDMVGPHQRRNWVTSGVKPPTPMPPPHWITMDKGPKNK